MWHAKRMHMEDMWGYRLAASPADKGARASYRFSRNEAVIYDMSYYTPERVEGEPELARLDAAPGGLAFRHPSLHVQSDLTCKVVRFRMYGSKALQTLVNSLEIDDPETSQLIHAIGAYHIGFVPDNAQLGFTVNLDTRPGKFVKASRRHTEIITELEVDVVPREVLQRCIAWTNTDS
jgi:hypothetical protein